MPAEADVPPRQWKESRRVRLRQLIDSLFQFNLSNVVSISFDTEPILALTLGILLH